MRLAIVLAAAAALAGGCIGQPSNPAATQPVTDVDLATTQPSYWLDQPATATAQAADFNALFAACEDTARSYFFRLDRIDFRSGLLTTLPMISAQWFEPWRADTVTLYDRTESSIASIRRTARFEIARNPEGVYEATPKVLVERLSLAEQRITSVVLYRTIFTRPIDARLRQSGSREADAGVMLQRSYWYPVRRDSELEAKLAAEVQKRVARPQTAQVEPATQPES